MRILRARRRGLGGLIRDPFAVGSANPDHALEIECS
jgi:phosphoribosylformylglycinamidine (FGAM) synthase-like enzyme